MSDKDNPCVGICEIQDGYCIGCGRSADEVFGDIQNPPPAAPSPSVEPTEPEPTQTS